MIQKSIDKGILKFANKPMGVDTNPFPKVSSNMVTPNLSKLTRLRSKIDLGQGGEISTKNKYGKVSAKTIHDLEKNYENKQQKKSINKTNLTIKNDLSKKMIDELLEEIREQ